MKGVIIFIVVVVIVVVNNKNALDLIKQQGKNQLNIVDKRKALTNTRKQTKRGKEKKTTPPPTKEEEYGKTVNPNTSAYVSVDFCRTDPIPSVVTGKATLSW